MSKPKLLWYLFCLLWSLGVTAGDDLSVLDGFVTQTTRSAKFIEQRTAFYLEEPIVSHGEMTFVAPSQLRKTITRPEPSTQIIEAEQLTIESDDEPVYIDLSQQPDLLLGVNALRWVLSGDKLAMQKNFYIDAIRKDGKWNLSLKPKLLSSPSKIKSITFEIEGARIMLMSIVSVDGEAIKTTLYGHR